MAAVFSEKQMTVERDIDTSSGAAIAGVFGDTGYYRKHPFLAIEICLIGNAGECASEEVARTRDRNGAVIWDSSTG
jgi:hypothetical protein